MFSTNEVYKPFALGVPYAGSIVPGPNWTSFEEFRKCGNVALQSIPQHGIATLRTKSGTFRIMHDVDFQRLLGLASEIERLQGGLRVVITAAKVFAKHPDQEHRELLLQSASMLAECPILPQRQGHEEFQLAPEEVSQHSCDELDLETVEIPRPKL